MHHRFTRTIALALAAASLAGACTSRTTSTSPVEPSLSGSALGTASTQPQLTLAGKWTSVAINKTAAVKVSGAPAALSDIACGSFAWTSVSTTSTDVSGNFNAICNGVPVSGTGNGHLSGSTATVNLSGAGFVLSTVCNFTIAAQGPLSGDVLQLSYTGTSCAGPFSGSESLRRSDIFPDPTTSITNPPPSNTPPSSGGSGPDELSFNDVTVVLGSNVANWAITDSILGVTRTGTTLCINHSKAGQWPTLPWFGDSSVLVEGNQWMFANINGRWYGAAGEWLRPGQVCKDVGSHVGEGAFYGTIMGSWTPQPGELIGLAVSTPARAGQWGSAERSNTVFFHW